MDQTGDDTIVDLILYQQLVTRLMYLVYKTRPDIFFVVWQLSIHNFDPKAGYISVVKQVV